MRTFTRYSCVIYWNLCLPNFLLVIFIFKQFGIKSSKAPTFDASGLSAEVQPEKQALQSELNDYFSALSGVIRR